MLFLVIPFLLFHIGFGFSWANITCTLGTIRLCRARVVVECCSQCENLIREIRFRGRCRRFSSLFFLCARVRACAVKVSCGPNVADSLRNNEKKLFRKIIGSDQSVAFGAHRSGYPAAATTKTPTTMIVHVRYSFAFTVCWAHNS